MIDLDEEKPQPWKAYGQPRPPSGTATIVLFVLLVVTGIMFYTYVNTHPTPSPTANPIKLCQIEGIVFDSCIYESLPICDEVDGADQPYGCLLIDRRAHVMRWLVANTTEFEAACQVPGIVRPSCATLDLPECQSSTCGDQPGGGIWIDPITGAVSWIPPRIVE